MVKPGGYCEISSKFHLDRQSNRNSVTILQSNSPCDWLKPTHTENSSRIPEPGTRILVRTQCQPIKSGGYTLAQHLQWHQNWTFGLKSTIKMANSPTTLEDAFLCRNWSGGKQSRNSTWASLRAVFWHGCYFFRKDANSCSK